MSNKYIEVSKDKLVVKLMEIRRNAKNANSKKRYDRTVKRGKKVQKEYESLLKHTETNFTFHFEEMIERK